MLEEKVLCSNCYQVLDKGIAKRLISLFSLSDNDEENGELYSCEYCFKYYFPNQLEMGDKFDASIHNISLYSPNCDIDAPIPERFDTRIFLFMKSCLKIHSSIHKLFRQCFELLCPAIKVSKEQVFKCLWEYVITILDPSFKTKEYCHQEDSILIKRKLSVECSMCIEPLEADLLKAKEMLLGSPTKSVPHARIRNLFHPISLLGSLSFCIQSLVKGDEVTRLLSEDEKTALSIEIAKSIKVFKFPRKRNLHSLNVNLLNDSVIKLFPLLHNVIPYIRFILPAIVNKLFKKDAPMEFLRAQLITASQNAENGKINVNGSKLRELLNKLCQTHAVRFLADQNNEDAKCETHIKKEFLVFMHLIRLLNCSVQIFYSKQPVTDDVALSALVFGTCEFVLSTLLREVPLTRGERSKRKRTEVIDELTDDDDDDGEEKQSNRV